MVQLELLMLKNQKKLKKIIFDKNFEKKYAMNDELAPTVTDISFSSDFCSVVVTSRNWQAKMYDITNDNWDVIREINTNRGLNTCAIHPKLDCVVVGGGKTAQQAAIDNKNGNYEILFYSTIYGEEMGRIETDCFSPINSMTFSSDGSQFILGYEEGTVRIFQMDMDFKDKYVKYEDTFINKKNDDDDITVSEFGVLILSNDNHCGKLPLPLI